MLDFQMQHFARVKSGTRMHRVEEVSEFTSTADSLQEVLLQFWTAFWKKRSDIKSRFTTDLQSDEEENIHFGLCLLLLAI